MIPNIFLDINLMSVFLFISLTYEKAGEGKKWNIYYCYFSDTLGWIEESISEENFACINQVIAAKNLVNKSPNIVVFDDQDDIYYSITYTPYKILGEPIDISTPIKAVYNSSFVMDEYGFIHCVWTSQQADGETMTL